MKQVRWNREPLPYDLVALLIQPLISLCIVGKPAIYFWGHRLKGCSLHTQEVIAGHKPCSVDTLAEALNVLLVAQIGFSFGKVDTETFLGRIATKTKILQNATLGCRIRGI